ncbi:MAG: serine hydrolase [Lactobacillaceae bacterium]|jgi:D-alanyl-D-alanine carboxypeptidase (penicillin-binding protein 5/6)|nr:serine hydrolase [Lactobacillaceae bacterium]
MKNKFLKYILGFFVTFFIVSFFIGVMVNIKTKTNLKSPILDASPIEFQNLNAKSSTVVSMSNGQIIAQKDSNKMLPMASTAKLMTAYILYSEIKKGKISWNDRVKISNDISELSLTDGLANVPLYSDDTYTIKNLLISMLDVSANASAMAIGNFISGSPDEFAKLMNQTAKEMKLPIDQYKFYNASGLRNGDLIGSLKLNNVSDDSENEISASALATLSYNLFKKFPEVSNIMQQSEIEFPQNKLGLVQTFLTTTSSIRGFLGVNDYKLLAAKTGSSKKAGSVLVGLFFQKNNLQNYISIVMNGSDMNDPSATWEKTLLALESADSKGQFLNYKIGESVKGAEKISFLSTEKETIDLGLSKPINIWINEKKVANISANGFSYNRSLSSVSKKDVFKTSINNVKNLKKVYGVNSGLKIKLSPLESSKENWNPLEAWYRYLIH